MTKGKLHTTTDAQYEPSSKKGKRKHQLPPPPALYLVLELDPDVSLASLELLRARLLRGAFGVRNAVIRSKSPTNLVPAEEQAKEETFAYDIATNNVAAAIRELVESVKKHESSVGFLKAKCHDGSICTIRIKV